MVKKSNLQKKMQAKIAESTIHNVNKSQKFVSNSILASEHQSQNANTVEFSLFDQIPEVSIIRSFATKMEITALHKRNWGQMGRIIIEKTMFDESPSPELLWLIKKYESKIQSEKISTEQSSIPNPGSQNQQEGNSLSVPNDQIQSNLTQTKNAQNNHVDDIISLDLFYQQAHFITRHNELYQQIKEQYKNTPELCFLQGMIAFWNDQNESATQLLQQAITQGYHHALSYNTLGTIAMQKSDPSRAEAFFQRALQIDPTYETAMYNLCAVYAFRGDIPLAEQCIIQAMVLNPVYEKPYYGALQILVNPKYSKIKQNLMKIAIFLHPSGMGERNANSLIDIQRNVMEKIINLRITKRKEIIEKLFKIWAPYRKMATDPTKLMSIKEEIFKKLCIFAEELF